MNNQPQTQKANRGIPDEYSELFTPNQNLLFPVEPEWLKEGDSFIIFSLEKEVYTTSSNQIIEYQQEVHAELETGFN